MAIIKVCGEAAQRSWSLESSLRSGSTPQGQSGPAVVVVGSCNVDLIGYCPRMPKEGETLTGTSYQQSFGGKGANQAVQAGKMGASVAMLGKVGQDALRSKGYNWNCYRG